MMTPVEQALPAHMLFLMAERMKQKGYELRRDIFMHLDRAAAAALAGLDRASMRFAAMKVDRMAHTLLRDLNMDDPRDELMACAYFTLKMVDEGLYGEPNNQAVLVSLLLMEDSKDEGSAWTPNEKAIAAKAGSMLRRANILGLYVKPLAQATLH